MISYLQSHGDMSKIRSLVYIPDIQNLQTRILLFPNQKKKMLKQIAVSLGLFMNTNKKNSYKSD